MALPWFFAVDHLASTGQALGDDAFDSIGGTTSISGVLNGHRWLAQDDTAFATKSVPAGTEFTVGNLMRRNVGALTQPKDVLRFYNSAAQTILSLYFNASTARLEVRRGSTVLATSNSVFADGQEWYVEMYVKLDDSAGAFEVRINGATEMQGSGIDTNNTADATCESINFQGSLNTAGSSLLRTYFYINDTPGGEFYGPILMTPIRPTADVTAQFTRSTGTTNTECIDEEQCNEDTDFNESNNVGDEDLFTLEDIPSSLTTILAVAVMTVAEAPNAGAPHLAHLLDDGVNTVVGPTQSPGSALYRTQVSTHMTAPDGGAWTQAKVNALRAGYRNVA